MGTYGGDIHYDLKMPPTIRVVVPKLSGHCWCSLGDTNPNISLEKGCPMLSITVQELVWVVGFGFPALPSSYTWFQRHLVG